MNVAIIIKTDHDWSMGGVADGMVHINSTSACDDPPYLVTGTPLWTANDT